MSDATRISEMLNLRSSPVAVAFRAQPPDGMPKIDEPAVSGCTYWKLAAEGRAFYTEARDHYGCPVGAHTHGIDLPEETARELEGLVGTMVELQYLAAEEVPGIPQLSGPFGVAMYAPLDEAPFEPDVVMFRGNAKQIMLLAEAAHKAGLASDSSMVGRPTCAAIPAVMQSRRTATNLGCIGNRVYTELDEDELYFVAGGDEVEFILGNRVYTELDEDELYFVAAGEQVSPLADNLAAITHANTELEAFHRGRLADAS